MKRKLLKYYPLPVVLLVCGLLGWVYERDAKLPLSPSLFQRFEWYLHDWRVQLAYPLAAPSAATNLVVVEINDPSLRWMRDKFPKLKPRWPFHHFLYGPMLNELKEQGARTVAFDILFVSEDDDISRLVVLDSTSGHGSVLVHASGFPALAGTSFRASRQLLKKEPRGKKCFHNWPAA